jgi:hypothetical protein
MRVYASAMWLAGSLPCFADNLRRIEGCDAVAISRLAGLTALGGQAR